MRSVQDAIVDILSHVRPLDEVESVDLLGALGRVLAKDVYSDVDLPPFQKSAMDGFALRGADLEGSSALLKPVGESRAGAPFGGSVAPGQCIEIFTGAEVPADCDTVVMVEHSAREGDSVRLDGPAKQGQNICNRGEDLASGQKTLEAGRRLSATDLSVLAAVGCSPVPVVRRPRVAILTTGDELVPPEQVPGAGQIREGNTFHLAALARAAGTEVAGVGLVPDRLDELEARFGAALEDADVVMTTGGVSMGKYDLVAQVFHSLGVHEIFHKVAIKPGKPLWFGKRGDTLVFGLPGNPVSCLVDHEVFVRPALAKLAGAPESAVGQRLRQARWCAGEMAPHFRERYVPVGVRQSDEGVEELRRLKWSGSADIVGLAEADGLVRIPAGEGLSADARATYLPLSRP